MSSVKPRAKAPQVVYYQPAPVYTPPPVDTGPSDEEVAENTQKEKEKNLLRRARGTIGTVMNGFRGILSSSDTSGQRKSLLGE